MAQPYPPPPAASSARPPRAPRHRTKALLIFIAMLLAVVAVAGLFVRSAVQHASVDGRLLIGVIGGGAFVAMLIASVRSVREGRRRMRGASEDEVRQWRGEQTRQRQQIRQFGSALAIILAVVGASAGGTFRGAVFAAFGAVALAVVLFCVADLVTGYGRDQNRGARP